MTSASICHIIYLLTQAD